MEMHDRLEGSKIIIKIDPELMELIPAFLNNRYADILLMQDALKKGDYEIIERAGHGMKGSGAGFGFEAITEIGKSLEKAAQDKDVASIQESINRLSDYMKHIEVIYG